MTFAQTQGGSSQTRAVRGTATPLRRGRHGSAVPRVATLAVLGLLAIGSSPAAAQTVISSGPTTSPGGGWSCTGAVAGNEKLAGGATWTCAGTAGAFSNLYLGINKSTGSPYGETMVNTGATEPSGT